MKREIIRTLIGLIAGLIAGALVMLAFKRGDINSMNFDDIVPLIGILPYFIYNTFKRIKDIKRKEERMYESLTKSKVYANDNLLITINKEEKKVNVRNDMFWNDSKPMDAEYYDRLFESLIKDFKKLAKDSKSFREIMTDKVIEFTLIDNINEKEDKILKQKSIDFNHL